MQGQYRHLPTSLEGRQQPSLMPQLPQANCPQPQVSAVQEQTLASFHGRNRQPFHRHKPHSLLHTSGKYCVRQEALVRRIQRAVH